MTRPQGVDYSKTDIDPYGDRPGPWMQTITGRQFFPLDIRAEDLDIEDIAHALGALCRYNGHTSGFYSVAEHCVLMTQHAFIEHRSWTPFKERRAFLRSVLMHDAAEAYIGDYPHAIKKVVPGIKRLEGLIEDVLTRRYKLLTGPETKAAVKELDRRIVANERQALLPSDHPWVADAYKPLDVTIRCWDPAEAKRAFLDLYDQVKPNGGTNDD